jgi:hypothetical protein
MPRRYSLKESLQRPNRFAYYKKFDRLVKKLTKGEISPPAKGRALWDLRSVCRIQRWMREADSAGKQRICRLYGTSAPELETLVRLARDRFARACGNKPEERSAVIDDFYDKADRRERRRTAISGLLSEAENAKAGHG